MRSKKNKKKRDNSRVRGLGRDNPRRPFGLEDVAMFLSCAFVILILTVSWGVRQNSAQNPEDRPHTHAETIKEDDPKKLPELSAEDIKKINTYEGLVYQSKEDPEKKMEEEAELIEKIKKEEEEKRIATAKARARMTPVKKVVSRRVGAPASIHAETKNTRFGKVCEYNNDDPHKSNKNEKWHIDTECCLDPDEIPNSNCYYPPEIYGKLIERYLNRK